MIISVTFIYLVLTLCRTHKDALYIWFHLLLSTLNDMFSTHCLIHRPLFSLSRQKYFQFVQLSYAGPHAMQRQMAMVIVCSEVDPYGLRLSGYTQFPGQLSSGVDMCPNSGL